MVHDMLKFLDKPLFNMPKWLKPELNRPIYYVHIAIILGVIYTLMQYIDPGNNLLLYGVFLVIGDFAAHTLLGMD